jgi:hypothetical protein
MLISTPFLALPYKRAPKFWATKVEMADPKESMVNQIKKSSFPQTAHAAMLFMPKALIFDWIVILAIGYREDWAPMSRPKQTSRKNRQEEKQQLFPNNSFG